MINGNMSGIKPSNICEYIEAAPPAAQEKLREIRPIFKKVAPNATEMLPAAQARLLLYIPESDCGNWKNRTN